MTDISDLRRILNQNTAIAVVGLSANWWRPSFFAAKYLQDHGYRIIPVNPNYEEILGQKCYPALEDIPDPVDVVDVFQRSDVTPPLATSAVAIGAKVFWLQLGVVNEEAASIARDSGLEVVMDRCMKIEHARLMGAAVVCILIPLIAAFYHFHPSQKGVSAFRSRSNRERSPNRPRHGQSERPEWNLRQALASYRLWLLVISNMCFWGSGCYLVIAHQIKFALDMGYTGILATSVFAMFGIFMVVGQVSSAVSDIVGRELTVLVATILVVLAILLLSSVSDDESAWKLYVYAITFGFGAGLYSPTIFVGAADIFHGRHFGTLNGIILAGLGFGGAFGPSLGGYLHDIFGSYRYAFFFAIASFTVAGISFIVAAPRHYRQCH